MSEEKYPVTIPPYQCLPPLTDTEYETLKADIANHGVQVPVEVDEHGNIIDGHHRVRACRELGIRNYPQLVRSGLTESEKRAQVVALACRAPRQYDKPWQRWSGEKLAQVAGEQQIVAATSPGTIRRWLRTDKLKPWRYHSWQHSTDPQFVEKAVPVLDLYAQAPALQAQGELTVCTDEKPSLQARQRVTATKAATLGKVLQVADRDKRMGALPLFCALGVASGRSITARETAPARAEWQAK